MYYYICIQLVLTVDLTAILAKTRFVYSAIITTYTVLG